ncbi:O-methyltransferase [Clostridia bacterium]|nr:O-methyltransferase [Clostridia bacterium]
MNNDERMAWYLRSLLPDFPEDCENIAKVAEKEYVPIIKRETANLIKTLLLLIRPERVLEIGTAIAYSTIFMAKYLPAKAKITTIEQNEKRILSAKKNIERLGLTEKIELKEGNASEILSKLTENYEFIFMDAAKGQYGSWLPHLLSHLKTGGILLSDNVFFEGRILESRFLVSRRQRTIHSRMRQFLYQISHHEQLQTTVLPIGDGVSLSVKCEP